LFGAYRVGRSAAFSLCYGADGGIATGSGRRLAACGSGMMVRRFEREERTMTVAVTELIGIGHSGLSRSER
jgi:hypothetical protein